MSFFRKIFGTNTEHDNSNLSTKNDTPKIWLAKFYLMAIAETSYEVPSIDDFEHILNSTFSDFKQNEIQNVHTSILTMLKNSAGSKIEWDKKWEIFSSQHSFFKISDSFSVCRELASLAFNLKMAEGMQEISENFNYRIGFSEKYFKISKSDFIEIIEEEREKSGYNNFVNTKQEYISPSDNLNLDHNFNTSNKTNQNKKATNNEIPDYLIKAKVEYDLASNNCKTYFKNYVQYLEELIKKARIPQVDKEIIIKNINHGQHKNFDNIDLDNLLKITVKYVFALDMNFKANFKASESEFILHLKKYKTSKEKYQKISSKPN